MLFLENNVVNDSFIELYMKFKPSGKIYQDKCVTLLAGKEFLSQMSETTFRWCIRR
jgi:hypothetical protein